MPYRVQGGCVAEGKREILRRLGLVDAISIIVGIIVGAGIFETAGSVAGCVTTTGQLYLLWFAGGVLSLTGALCYAELATTYPEEGGDVVYLERAYGPWAGFLFAWANALVVRPGSIAAVSFAFARYGATLLPDFGLSSSGLRIVLALAAVLATTALNVIGVRASARTQNVLVAAKLLGLGAVVLAALSMSDAPRVSESLEVVTGGPLLGLILVLFTYGGWNDIVYVAGEVDRPERNLFWALVLGTAGVIVLYLGINWAYVHALGLAGLAASRAAATDTVAAVFPDGSGRLVAALICVCTLGAINGTVFTGARIYSALGERVAKFAALGRWNMRFHTPAVALAVQGILSVFVILATGSFTGSVVYTTSVVWVFFLAAGLAVFVLRRLEPERRRPHPTFLHPLTTVVFCLSCCLLVYSAIDYDPKGSLVALGLVVAGVPIYWLCKGA